MPEILQNTSVPVFPEMSVGGKIENEVKKLINKEHEFVLSFQNIDQQNVELTNEYVDSFNASVEGFLNDIESYFVKNSKISNEQLEIINYDIDQREIYNYSKAKPINS
jgi:hypothetical protein